MDVRTPLLSLALLLAAAAPAAADMAVSPTAQPFPEVKVDGGSTLRRVTITNNGSQAFSASLAVVSGAADYSLELASVGPILPGATARVGIVFDPADVGTRTGVVRVSANDPAIASVDVAVTGTGVRKRIELSPKPLDYGDLDLYAFEKPLDVSIQAVGNRNVTVSRMEITGPDADRFWFAIPGGSPCSGKQVCDRPFQINAGTLRAITVRARANRRGAMAATLTVISNADNAATENTIPIVAHGVSAEVAVTPSGPLARLDFPHLPIGATSAAQMITVRNVASGPDAAPLRFTPYLFDTAGEQSFQIVPGCEAPGCTLAPGASQTLAVTFTPYHDGPEVASVQIWSNDLASPATDWITLRGVGTIPGIVVEEPAAYELALGPVFPGESTPEQVVRVRNDRDEPLELTENRLWPSDPVAFTSGPRGAFTVPPRSTVTWSFACQPEYYEGRTWQDLTIEAADPALSVHIPVYCQTEYRASSLAGRDPGSAVAAEGQPADEADVDAELGGCSTGRGAGTAPLGLALGVLIAIRRRRTSGASILSGR